jgi:hypothetical protein
MDDDEFESELRRHDLRADGDEPDDGGSWGFSPGRIASLVLVGAMLAFWIWAFSPWAPRGHPDELDDSAFSELAEVRCAASVEDLNAVPGARNAADLADRAQQIEQTSAILSIMVVDLAEYIPAGPSRDADLVERWLRDWDIYIGDRLKYAEKFSQGIDTAFEVTAIDGDQVTSALDLFATINRMPSCVAPGDV